MTRSPFELKHSDGFGQQAIITADGLITFDDGRVFDMKQPIDPNFYANWPDHPFAPKQSVTNSNQLNCTTKSYNSKEGDKKAPSLRKKRAPKIDTFMIPGAEVCLNSIAVMLPIKAISEANVYQHWTVRADRKRGQKAILHAGLSPYLSMIKLPCCISLHRYGPKLLDAHDNLPASFKSLVDFTAELLTGKGRGRGDSDPRLSWKYSQEKSKDYGVKITFEF